MAAAYRDFEIHSILFHFIVYYVNKAKKKSKKTTGLADWLVYVPVDTK